LYADNFTPIKRDIQTPNYTNSFKINDSYSITTGQSRLIQHILESGLLNSASNTHIFRRDFLQ
jgi:hypothetical protein